jgi:putative ABC transport system permease protein
MLSMFGIVFGQAGIFLFTRFLSGLLFGISATDPMTLIGVTLLMVAAALIAAYVPARTVRKLDPAKVLRDL